eukprot:gene39698-48334_t
MFISTLRRTVIRRCFGGLLFKSKSFIGLEKPTLIGSVLREVIVKHTQRALMSSEDNCAKRFLVDESSLAVLSTAEKLSQLLKKNDIQYAIVGGFALNIHGFKRQTTDIDVLMSKAGLQKFKEKLVHNGFSPRFRGAEISYRDPVSNVSIDILLTGNYPGDGKPSALAFPEVSENNVMDFDGIKVIDLKTLISLKLASYKSLPQSRMKDRTDVSGLVKYLTLDESFAERLHESVRDEYLKIVLEVVEEEKRNET